MEIKFKTIESNIPTLSENARCTARIVNNAILGPGDIANEIAVQYGIDVSKAKYMVDVVSSYAVQGLCDGKKLDFGPFSMALTLKGTVSGANGSFDPERNSLGAALTLGKEAKEKLAALRPVNVNGAGAPIIRRLMAEGGEEGVVRLGFKVFISGLNLETSATNPDEGIWLCDAKTSQRLMKGRVLQSTSTTFDGIFDSTDALLPGKYRLELTSRGPNPSQPAPCKCFKSVQVVA